MSDPEEIKTKALKFIKEQQFAIVSTASAKGEPQAATMAFLVEDDFTFYFITMNDSTKINNLKQNDKVAITLGFGPQPTTIQAGGRAEIIPDVPDELFQKIIGSSPTGDISKWPILKLAKKGFSTIKVRPTWMKWLDLNPNSQTYKEEFQKVI